MARRLTLASSGRLTPRAEAQTRWAATDRQGENMNPQMYGLDRRRFLKWASAMGAFFAAHGWSAEKETASGSLPELGGQDGPRLQDLRLVSAVPLAQMKEFYQGVLGLQLLDYTPDRLTIGAGQTRLTFLKPAADSGNPFYHFAFNIPENKVLTAHQWQKKRTPLLPIPETLRDRNYPDDVVNYSHWNAHSIFFFDPCGNVVEYIARHDLRNAAPGDFGSRDILYASEIAFVVDNVAATAAKLKEIAGLGQYRGASDQFAALGDENGLLLVMKRGRVISFDAPEKKAVSVFPTAVAVRSDRRANYVFPEFPYEVFVEE